MRVLVACEYSGTVRRAFDARAEAARLNAATVSANVHYVANPTPKEIAQ